MLPVHPVFVTAIDADRHFIDLYDRADVLTLAWLGRTDIVKKVNCIYVFFIDTSQVSSKYKTTVTPKIDIMNLF